MDAFWWFEENAVAGMAQPGFNGAHWYDLPLDEALLLGWLGVQSGGPSDLALLHAHIDAHSRKIAGFYKIDETERARLIAEMTTQDGLTETAKRLSARSNVVSSFAVTETTFEFAFCPARLEHELSFLEQHGIQKVVSLTEDVHRAAELKDRFDHHHFAIADLGAPTIAQVQDLAHILQASQREAAPVVIHCMAGIGRTSTMIIAAHMALGHALSDLLDTMSVRNPTYQLTGPQGAFLTSLERELTG